MKSIFFITTFFLTTSVLASGCNWDDHTVDGWDRTSLQTIAETNRIFHVTDVDLQCVKDVPTLIFKNKPQEVFTTTEANCQATAQMLSLNEGSSLKFLQEKVRYQAYDNCGTDVGKPINKEENSFSLVSKSGTPVLFVSPVTAKAVVDTFRCTFTRNKYLEAKLIAKRKGARIEFANVTIFKFDSRDERRTELASFTLNHTTPEQGSLAYQFQSENRAITLVIFAEDMGGMSYIQEGPRKSSLTCASENF